MLERARKFGVATRVFSSKEFRESDTILETLKAANTTHIVLAGFLLMVPANLLRTFQGKIVNIHPALLPKFGGKGMYGARVHEAVIEAREKETGITIHMVNEKYDDGKILFQATCPVDEGDHGEKIAEKVHALEHAHYPRVIEKFVMGEFKT